MSPMPSDQRQDDEIRLLLERAQDLQRSLPPLATWSSLCDTIDRGDLADLERHPVLERVYAEEFNPLIRERYGSVENYLRRQLGWDERPRRRDDEDPREYWTRLDDHKVRINDWGYAVPKDVQHYVVWVPLPLFHRSLCSPSPSSSTSSSSSPSTFHSTSSSSSSSASSIAVSCSTPSRRDSQDTSRDTSSIEMTTTTTDGVPNATFPNEAGQGLQGGERATWEWVSHHGLSGLTGKAQVDRRERVQRRRRQRQRRQQGERDEAERGDRDGAGETVSQDDAPVGGGRGVADERGGGRGRDERGLEGTAERQEDGPGREIDAFVRDRWKVEDGWETAWFANPPGLQSVPGLAHFHVLARKS
ncbi:hypothetical protein JCM10212_004318 [Sporobolomyces blumeae]